MTRLVRQRIRRGNGRRKQTDLDPPMPTHSGKNTLPRFVKNKPHQAPEKDVSAQTAGKPLDKDFRTRAERAAGGDLGGVKLHATPQDRALADSLNARAFTYGGDIWLGSKARESDEGLMAHEAAHAIQQRSGRTQPDVVQRTPEDDRDTKMPHYSQEGDTCGAASLVSALMIWDRQNATADNRHPKLVEAINLTLVRLIQRASRFKKNWKPQLRGGDVTAEDVHDQVVSILYRIRDAALPTGPGVTEEDYQAFGEALYLMYIDRSIGLDSKDIASLQGLLGLDTSEDASITQYSDVFSNRVVTGLQPGEIAQVGWFVQQGPPNEAGKVKLGDHTFLIGRFQTGNWFLSDQGTQPAYEFSERTLEDLQLSVERAARSAGGYWLFTGTIGPLISGWRGATLLAGADAVGEERGNLIAEGTHLAQVDQDEWTFGDDIYAGAFVGSYNSVMDAHYAAGNVGDGHGAAIIEMPRGAYLVYETNLVRRPNLMVSDVDRGAGGKLVDSKLYYGAELVLCDGDACTKLTVY